MADKRKIIDSIKFYSPIGQFMFYANSSRAAWYYRKGLSEKISDNPLAFRLKFWPQGLGRSSTILQKKNQCVICGITTHLTRHHIVPKLYRQYMQESFKTKNDYDVQVVCRTCHDKYEIEATKYKKKLAQPFQFDKELYKEAKRITKAAKIIMSVKKLPDKRLLELYTIINSAGVSIETDTLLRIANIDIKWDPYQAKKVVKYWSHDLREFIFRWRKHFITYSQPQYLPTGWTWDSESFKVNKKVSVGNFLAVKNR